MTRIGIRRITATAVMTRVYDPIVTATIVKTRITDGCVTVTDVMTRISAPRPSTPAVEPHLETQAAEARVRAQHRASSGRRAKGRAHQAVSFNNSAATQRGIRVRWWLGPTRRQLPLMQPDLVGRKVLAGGV